MKPPSVKMFCIFTRKDTLPKQCVFPIKCYYIIVRIRLHKWILCLVKHSLRLVEADLIYINTDVFEYFVKSLSIMTECYSTMMRVVAFDQYMTVETTHLWDCEDTDRTKGTSCNRKNFTVCDVSTKFCISSTLQTEESDVSRYNVSLESSV